MERKKVRLVISCVPKELMLSMDEDLMMSLLMNLVDNACKASLEGGTIRVSANARTFKTLCEAERLIP